MAVPLRTSVLLSQNSLNISTKIKLIFLCLLTFVLSDCTVKADGDENLEDNETVSLLRNKKPVAQENNINETIIRDDCRLIQGLRYMSMPINSVSSSAITTFIFAQGVTFCPTLILSSHFPFPSGSSAEPVLWK